MAQAWLSRKAQVMLLQPEQPQELQRRVARTEPEMRQGHLQPAQARQRERAMRLQRGRRPLLTQKLPVRQQSPK